MPAHTTNPGIRVMLVDKQRLVLCGLQRLLDDEKPDLAVVGTSTSCENAVDLAIDVAPDVVVLDAALTAQNEAVVPLMSERNMRVLLLGAMDASLTHEVAILRGACGVVRKEDTPEVLIKAIKSVHSGELWLDRSTTGRLFVELSRQNGRASANPVSGKLGSLTSREHDIVRSLVSRPGADNKTLAEELHIGEHTLRNHLSRIYDKLGVPNRVELYILAQRHGVNRRPSP
jgi:two-component system nitrate/nitrite response regulator NarL